MPAFSWETTRNLSIGTPEVIITINLSNMKQYNNDITLLLNLQECFMQNDVSGAISSFKTDFYFESRTRI
jgi:hypothetical protein